MSINPSEVIAVRSMFADSAKKLPTQLCRNSDGRIHSGFVIWQHVYADYGIPTFPVEIGEDEKKPLVRGYLKVWPDLSTKWAQQFPFAPTFGLVLGPKKWRTNRHGKTLPPASGIAELDVDSRDERFLADALIRHGYTPIVIRTASRKFKLLRATRKQRARAKRRRKATRKRLRLTAAAPLTLKSAMVG